MPKSPQSIESDSPLYIRWTPEICPYALEMRLDLITDLKRDLKAAERTGAEVSGLFVGVFPTHDSPTLRLDDVLIGHGAVLAREYAHTALHSQQAERPIVGAFRSQPSTSVMALTTADVASLRQRFPDGLFAFLLVSPMPGSASFQAGFYLAIGGQLPPEPSTPVFPFEESAFQSLPELPAEATEDVRNFNFAQAVKRPVPWAAVISFAVLLFLIATWIFGSRASQLFRPASNQIDLSVTSAGSNIKITWDHSSSIIARATGASMLIMDGRSHREVKLDTDDLKLGEVMYERLTKKVYVVMRIDSSGPKLPPQTFDWTAN